MFCKKQIWGITSTARWTCMIPQNFCSTLTLFTYSYTCVWVSCEVCSLITIYINMLWWFGFIVYHGPTITQNLFTCSDTHGAFFVWSCLLRMHATQSYLLAAFILPSLSRCYSAFWRYYNSLHYYKSCHMNI